MWGEAAGYWGVGKNTTGDKLHSARNDTTWHADEVLLHPKAGPTLGGLAIGWKSPETMVIDIRYTFAAASPHGNGIGYQILLRHRDGDTDIVSLDSVGESISNEIMGIAVAKDDRIFFRFHTNGDATGDITRTQIVITRRVRQEPTAITLLPAGAKVTEGSRLRFRVVTPDPGDVQWRKDDKAIAGATERSFLIESVTPADGGSYSVDGNDLVSQIAALTVLPETVRWASPVPRQVFSMTLAEQEKELKTNALMLRFAASRRKLARLPYRPAYHFVSPENMLNDPNGLCFWQGRWHLFYQAYPADEYPNATDIKRRRQHWGHAVSDDLVHWRDLPYAIYPGPERMCFSGSTLVEEHRVIAFYPGIGAGQMVAIADDPLLLNWNKIGPVNSGHGDADIWKEGDTYLGLVGRSLWASKDLKQWSSCGEFLTQLPFIRPDDDGACPNFEPIGDKHILLFFSHRNGGQYFLGDYANRRFTPYAHGRLNHGRVAPGGVHAPSSASDGMGGVINILNINDARYSEHWDQILSVPQRLTLGEDQLLRIHPVASLASLRDEHQHMGHTVLRANQEVVLPQIRGNTMELDLEIDPKEARWVQLTVLRSPSAEEQTTITYFNFERELTYWYQTPGEVVLDGSRSSTLDDVWLRPPERAIVRRDGQPLRMRVFIDRSVVEVFVNEQQYLAIRVYPGRDDSLGVSLRAQGQDAVLHRLDAWQMKSIWESDEGDRVNDALKSGGLQDATETDDDQ
jgi:beta-fructofuranosidase